MNADGTTDPATARHRRAGAVVHPLAILAAGALVALAVGAYARLHDPTGGAPYTFGFSTPLQMKVWLTTAALALGVVQLGTALAMYGRLGRAPAWAGPVHRLSGAGAFLLTVPVAFHYLWSIGFSTFDTRTLAHSRLGCAFYGAFAAKMLALRDRHAPGWLLPALGATVLTVLVGLWSTASLWFFTTVRTPLF